MLTGLEYAAEAPVSHLSTLLCAAACVHRLCPPAVVSFCACRACCAPLLSRQGASTCYLSSSGSSGVTSPCLRLELKQTVSRVCNTQRVLPATTCAASQAVSIHLLGGACLGLTTCHCFVVARSGKAMLDWMTCRAGQAVCDDPCCAAACAQPGAGSAGAEGTHPPAGKPVAVLLLVQLPLKQAGHLSLCCKLLMFHTTLYPS